MVGEFGVHPFLHLNCHHQIVFAKLNLQIYYPPLHSRKTWHYIQANTELIKQAINDFNWDRAFLTTNVNILSNFISHETYFPWVNKPIKSLSFKKKRHI